MRLYLNAESKNNYGYTPDWVKVSFEEDGIVYDLTLDISGEFDYDSTCLNCRCKGYFVPWVLWNCETGEETDLSELSDEELEGKFPIKRIVEIFENGFDFVVGVYPVNDTNTKDDVLSKGNGSVELYVYDEDTHYSKDFDFDIEFNF